LVSAQALHTYLQAATRAQAKGCDWALFEVSCDAHHAFCSKHIPGAHYIDTQALEAPPFWNAIDDVALLARLGIHGIHYKTTVVLYGRNQSAAARVAHLMLYAGVQDVRLLDGGFDSWHRAGFPCESGVAEAVLPAREFGLPGPGNPHFKIDRTQARRYANLTVSPTLKHALVSIRTWEEHTGQTSGYLYIKTKGDIPGALWGHAGKGGDVNDMSALQNADGTMRSASDLAALWERCGIYRDMDIAFYCGTGWRASLAFFYAWLMGWDRISVFDGGWFEWSSVAPEQDC
jgi:thiosulfate/3-mercaptopyruvate sulfurtransferase